MKPCPWSLILVIAYLLVFAAACHRQAGASLLQADALRLSANRAGFSERAPNAPAWHYRLDASRSKFVAHAGRAGLLWFKGHGHDIAVREFMGGVQLTPESITPASLEIIAKAASMEETSSVFT